MPDKLPLDIGRFFVRPGRRLCAVALKAINKPGVYAKLSSLTAEHNVNIIYVISSKPVEGIIPTLAFLDFTEADVSPEELASEVDKACLTEDVQLIKSDVEGYVADNVFFPLTVGGSRAVILLKETFLKGFLVDFRKRMGSAAEAVLYYIGFEAGKSACAWHAKLAEGLGIRSRRSFLRNIVPQIFRSLGNGILEIASLSLRPPNAVVRLHDNIECELGAEYSPGKPYSQWMRGVIAGYLSAFFDADIFTEEVKCLAKGDPFCEFAATKRNVNEHRR